MMLGRDLVECNRQLWLQHRRQIIEQAYRSSQQQHYHMPLTSPRSDSLSTDTIPSLYDLRTQNTPFLSPSTTPLVSVRELRRLNTPPTPLRPVRGMECTVGKRRRSEQLLRVKGRGGTWCCWGEDELQELRTRQVSMQWIGQEGQ